MTIVSHNKRLLDGEKSFQLWLELGSLSRVNELYKSQGIVNPKTGRPFRDMSIWVAAMRYVIENPEKAKPYYDEANGEEISQEVWEKWLIGRAFKVYGYARRRCVKWGRTQGLYPKYREIFEKTLSTYTLPSDLEEDDTIFDE